MIYWFLKIHGGRKMYFWIDSFVREQDDCLNKCFGIVWIWKCLKRENIASKSNASACWANKKYRLMLRSDLLLHDIIYCLTFNLNVKQQFELCCFWRLWIVKISYGIVGWPQYPTSVWKYRHSFFTSPKTRYSNNSSAKRKLLT